MPINEDAPVITLYFQFDCCPFDMSYQLNHTRDGGKTITIAHETFSKAAPFSSIEESFKLKYGKLYNLTIWDKGGDGFTDEDAYYQIYLGKKNESGVLLATGSGNFGKKAKHSLAMPDANGLPTPTVDSLQLQQTATSLSVASTKSSALNGAHGAIAAGLVGMFVLIVAFAIFLVRSMAKQRQKGSSTEAMRPINLHDLRHSPTKSPSFTEVIRGTYS